MEQILEKWADEYKLVDLKIVGYVGGYPMIQFKKELRMELFEKNKKNIDKIVRQAEMAGGFELGVGMNFRRTAGVIINDETIVIYGHEYVLKRILEKLF